MTRVAILGGGVGGLSAAHELADLGGFKVTVYEARDAVGGKARSFNGPKTGTGSDDDAYLPAEHGFRFFPGFYQHVTDTMRRIPFGNGNVYDNLTTCTDVLMAQDASAPGSTGVEVVTPIGPPDSVEDVLNALQAFREMFLRAGIKPQEFAVFLRQILYFMTSCDERRLGEFEGISWWDFIEAEGKTDAYQKFLATGMTRTLVAARAEDMSARTGGTVLCQLIYDMVQIDGRLDNVLNGPTSEVWIKPWKAYLENKGVTFKERREVAGINFDGTRITSVTISHRDEAGNIIADQTVDADYYIAAMPVEVFKHLVTDPMKAKATSLKDLNELKTEWMTGVMFYLDTDVELEFGHAIFIDSPWSLTAISQAQFWEKGYLQKRGDGRVEGVLSVDVSNWTKPGPVTKKAGIWCTEEEVYDEVWAQLKAHIETLDRSNVLAQFVDPAITFPNPGPNTNAEPLLINTKGSWKHRPEATTAIPNLFLAADFVQTKTDLATMEGANEAARAAVNGILKDCRPNEDPVKIFPLREPAIFKLHRFIDKGFYKMKRRPPAPFTVTDDGTIDMSGLRGRAAKLALRATDKRIRTRTFLTAK